MRSGGVTIVTESDRCEKKNGEKKQEGNERKNKAKLSFRLRQGWGLTKRCWD
jgi:hypothetical protein